MTVLFISVHFIYCLSNLTENLFLEGCSGALTVAGSFSDRILSMLELMSSQMLNKKLDFDQLFTRFQRGTTQSLIFKISL